MSHYLSLADYLLLVMQGGLSLAVLLSGRRFPFVSVKIWAAFSLLQVPAWWILAARSSAERYGDIFTRAGLFDALLVALAAVEMGAAILPEYRRRVWQLGPVCIAVSIVAGVMLWESGRIMAPAGYLGLSLIACGVSFGVLAVCLCVADRDAGNIRQAWTFAAFLGGQLAGAMMPGIVGCITPDCLTGHSAAAWFARRTGPILWAVTVAVMVWGGIIRKNRVTIGSEASA